MEHCLKEKQWGEINKTLEHHDRHVEDGEKPGGHRDRLLQAEHDIKSLVASIEALKKIVWVAAIVGGLIGGLIGNGAQEVVKHISRFI